MTSNSNTKQPPPPTRHLHITTPNPTSSSATTSSHSSRSPRVSTTAGGASSPSSGSGHHQNPNQQQNQACAACKYQRRKCNPDCPLARYFPADQQLRFLNAHRLFGVSNIQRTLRETPPELRTDAMRALIFQAEVRAYDPVGGCCRMAIDLQRQLDLAQAELSALLQQLELCRRQQHHAVDDDDQMLLVAGAGNGQDVVDDVAADALYANGAGGQENVVLGQANLGEHYLLEEQGQPEPEPHQLYDYFYYDGTAGDETSSHAWTNDVHAHQQQYGNNGGSPVELVEQLEQHCQIETQFVDVFDVKAERAAASSTAIESHINADNGNASQFEDLHENEEKAMVSTAVVKSELDHQVAAAAQMAESSGTGSHCQLELGFSSSNAW
ncbi:uncharacterized protein LOC104585088 [Brachypodium distachyon]|uniref:LOB domain-containing protein n=1 Tax=Brachypodium distachyon TaxID=15368 RepID=A0A0Q3IVG7_BRADI|nr:uncharacterized protein LOC104585088 [Brachypodium distachyon]KQJ90000.1 hypothetical protein BRADI_4g28883v3 [Brachypodium distachyon]|eukprot:XP_010239347.1 uncharacterized protein LOC104585088 [Brachypodium distachyon]